MSNDLKKYKYAIIGISISVLCTPQYVFSQTKEEVPTTHAQVYAELIALEKAGYDPGVDDPDYPVVLQNAERIVAMHKSNVENGEPTVAKVVR